MRTPKIASAHFAVVQLSVFDNWYFSGSRVINTWLIEKRVFSIKMGSFSDTLFLQIVVSLAMDMFNKNSWEVENTQLSRCTQQND